MSTERMGRVEFATDGVSDGAGRRHGVRFAGVGLRFLALAADLAVLSAVFLPVTRLVKGVWVMSGADHRWASGLFITDPLCIAYLVAMFLYFVLFEGLSGRTPGKWLLGLRVVSEDGSRASLGQALVRNILRIVDGLPSLGILGGILIVSSPERARFGDRVACTRVVRANR